MGLRVIQKCVCLSSRYVINSTCRKLYSFSLPLTNTVTLRDKAINFPKFNSRVINQFLTTDSSKCAKEEELDKQIPSRLHVNRITLRRRESAAKDTKLKHGVWTVKAISTAQEYDLERLRDGLLEEQLYEPHTITVASTVLTDVIHAVAKYEVQDEPREVFFFRDGVIVFWNVHDLECGNILKFIKSYELHPHFIDLIKAESEIMSYSHAGPGKSSGLKGDMFILGVESPALEKFTFSNVMVLSVKLGISEANLESYINSIEFVTDDLRSGKRLKLTQRDVLKKQGELFALRHEINLSSGLLDTPDCYWERGDLENLYHRTCNYFNISKRTRVINEKLNHCVELVGLLSTHLSDRHHVRLEWMIIVLIMVEVAFETLHYVDRFLS